MCKYTVSTILEGHTHHNACDRCHTSLELYFPVCHTFTLQNWKRVFETQLLSISIQYHIILQFHVCLQSVWIQNLIWVLLLPLKLPNSIESEFLLIESESLEWMLDTMEEQTLAFTKGIAHLAGQILFISYYCIQESWTSWLHETLGSSPLLAQG